MADVDPAREGRQGWLDAARGTVLAVMLLTPAFGPANAQRWFRHSPWDGVTISDLVFGSFLFLSGASLWFLLRNGFSPTLVRRLVKRFVALMVLGMLYNSWPTGADLGEVRITGVLQTIGVAGALAAGVIAVTRARPTLVATVAAGITVLWTVVVSRSCTPRCSPMFWLDQAVLPDRHLYRAGRLGYDPEGVGPMLIATALVLFGWLVNLVLQTHRERLTLLAPPAMFAVAGSVLWLLAAPNKRLATGAYTMIVALVATAVMYAWWAAERRSRCHRHQRRSRGGWWTTVVPGAVVATSVLGQNALVVFMSERFINASLVSTNVNGQPAWKWLATSLGVAETWSGVVVSGLVFGAVYAITAIMWRMHWRIVL